MDRKEKCRDRPDRHPLMRYMIKHKVSMALMCEMLGIGRQTIWRWFNYKREPSLTHALRIFSVTNGEIKLKHLTLDFFHDEDYDSLDNVSDSELL